jgi:hypothetical protein
MSDRFDLHSLPCAWHQQQPNHNHQHHPEKQQQDIREFDETRGENIRQAHIQKLLVKQHLWPLKINVVKFWSWFFTVFL